MKNSWGNYPSIDAQVDELWWVDELGSGEDVFLPVGLGRSYGDSATLLEKDGKLKKLNRCNRLLNYDETSRILHAEAGCSVGDILRWALPQGLFLPVVPGTQYVTLGGALANDIHGKNHHEAGTFGKAVREFNLMRSEDGKMSCSVGDELYCATIGGLGLTGVVTDLKVELTKIAGHGLVEEETRRFATINEACEQLEMMDQEYPMTVAWIDMGSRQSGAGVSMGGRFVEGEAEELKEAKLSVPCDAPPFLLNSWSIGTFNRFYGWSRREGKRRVSCGSYFFPLDTVGRWNRFYGKRGFVQYQCVVPLDARGVLEDLRVRIEKSDERAFLSVLKKFGDQESPGWLSFPRSGWTLAMDFPMRGESTLHLLGDLDELIKGCGGRLYPAKDARMASGFFKASYEKWEELERLRDPRIQSAFWKRMTV